jgi:hypothetical protein
MEKIKFYDIYDFIYIPFWKTKIFMIFAVTLLIIIFSIALFFLIRHIKNKNKQLRVITPWEQAIAELKELDPKNYQTKAEFKKFYFAITKIFKKYLKKQFSIPPLTDEELISRLQKQTVGGIIPHFDKDIINNLKTILQGSLLIKFANEQALREQAQKDLDSMILLIQKTIPENNSQQS